MNSIPTEPSLNMAWSKNILSFITWRVNGPACNHADESETLRSDQEKASAEVGIRSKNGLLISLGCKNQPILKTILKRTKCVNDRRKDRFNSPRLQVIHH
jgi:hypothetical protein